MTDTITPPTELTAAAPFALRNPYNPDVLTCIANLSNDEVFTPPDFANRMLDTLAAGWAASNAGANLWADSTVTFLDPFTKSGVFLREIVKRLVDGLADEIPDLQARVDHILAKQVFGIGITRLTSLLARRSVYCSKTANNEYSIGQNVFDDEDGNIWFERVEHTWVGGTVIETAGRDGKPIQSREGGRCKYCGSPQVTLVYIGSFQDLLGKDKAGNIKAKNEWLHAINWDLVAFDEYHFGAWRDNAKELFEGEDAAEAKKETAAEYNPELETINEDLDELGSNEAEFLPITTRSYLYLSGTPFKALATGEFIEEQLYNWTYTDEQRAKQRWVVDHPVEKNPYAALPEMRLLTYQMPDELIAIASQGEFDEFDLNEFFAATGTGATAAFKHNDDVQKWLNIIRGAYAPTQVDNLKLGSRKPPFPYSDTRLLPYFQHSFWFLPNVAASHAMANLLAEKQNVFFHDYQVLRVAGAGAGVGLAALPPVRAAIGTGYDTKTITLSCGKLTTGVTVPQWSSILMLRNLASPETYFQAAFRVQSPWSIKNPNGDNPHEEEVLKPVCFVFDFAPTRALRQIADYGAGLNPEAVNPEDAVRELVSFLPVLAYDGSRMTQVDAGGILDIAMSGTSATLLARKWESALLVNVDNDTLRKILNNDAARAAIMNIEGFRALGDSVFETIINKSEKVKAAKKEKGDDISAKEKKELTAEEKEYKGLRRQVQEKLVKFATRIPAFMYLTDFRENTLKDVITKLEPDLFRAVTGLTIPDFELLVSLNVFNSAHMNQAVFAFRRYEDSSLAYTGIDSHEGLTHVGLYDTVVAVED